MSFKKLQLNRWQQFDDIEIEFHPRVTILTGSNGSGKTTLLKLLANHCGWSFDALAMPDNVNGGIKWATPVGEDLEVASNNSSVRIVGQIDFDDTLSERILAPITSGNASYQLGFENHRSVNGFFMPSHRQVFRYEALAHLDTNMTSLSKQSAFQKITGNGRSLFYGGSSNRTTPYLMKEILISWSIYGEGNTMMEPIPIYTKYFREFEDILHRLLPSNLGFKRLRIRNNELILDCGPQSFILDGASGGLASLIEMAWDIYMFDSGEAEFVVIIDEIENHLHPVMQRRILGDLLNAFPRARFVVSTHSPLVVGSVRESSVYALRMRDGRTSSEKLDLQNQARTANEILDEVLGVGLTMPIWAERDLLAAIEAFTAQPLTSANFLVLRNKLSAIGLESYMPLAIQQVLEKNEELAGD